MGIDLSRFKVIHGDRVLNAVALMEIEFDHKLNKQEQKMIEKPKFIDILAINGDGNIILIHDEAWTFQFIPIITKQAAEE